MNSLEAKHIFKIIREKELQTVHLVFALNGDSCLHGISGFLQLDLLTVHGYETTESLVYTLCDDQGNRLPSELGRNMLLYGQAVEEGPFRTCHDESRLDDLVRENIEKTKSEIRDYYQTFFNEKSVRLEYWATSLEDGLEAEIKKIAKQIEQLDRQAQKTPNRTPEERLEYQKQKSELEKLRNAKRRSLFDDQDKVEERREAMISGLLVQLDSPEVEIRRLLLISFETV